MGEMNLLQTLKTKSFLVSDGATGTYLQSNGLEPGACPEELNITKPELIVKMAEDYFNNGADVVLTNSFGANPFMLSKYGLRQDLKKLNTLAAQLPKSVCPNNKFVLGSVGPTGEFLAPLGTVTEQEMSDGFIEQIEALGKGGADGIIIETMTSLEETLLAVRAVKENTDLVAMATMTFDLGPRGFFTMMGVTPEDAVTEIRKSGADVVGANCGNGIENMVQIAKKMRKADDGFLIIHSNAGIPEIINGRIIYAETPEFMAEKFKEMIELKINIFGGCCGTTPQHINSIKSMTKQQINKGKNK